MTHTPSALTQAQRIRGLEMPWNRVLRSSATPEGAARALGPWHPQEFLAECVETIPEAGDMMTFVFRRLDGAPLAFRSGQYLNIEFPVHGPDQDPVDRSYSISSAPTQPWTFAVTVKRDPGGLVSPWVHEHVRPGTVLDMLGPVGAFHLPDVDRRARYLLLAAGAGVTPLMSMIRTIHTLPGHADIVMLYHGAVPGGFTFSQELEHLAATDTRIKVVYSLGDRSIPGTWEGMVGRLTPAMVDEIAPDANGRQVFACGPEGYLNAAVDLLRKVGVDDSSINVEYFSGDRQTLKQYQEEVAIAGELAEEHTAAATDEYYEQQPSAFDLYTPSHDADGTLEADGLKLELLTERTGSDDEEAAADALAAPNLAAEASETTAEIADAGTVAAAAENGDAETVGEGEFTMRFIRTGKNVRIDRDERVLDVAKRAGVRIPMNCQEGMCGSCKVVKLEGDVEMHHQGGIRAREIEAGKFLPCCSTPQSDLVIDA